MEAAEPGRAPQLVAEAVSPPRAGKPVRWDGTVPREPAVEAEVLPAAEEVVAAPGAPEPAARG